jgi:phosphatidylglycerophosphate synthase
VIRQAALYLSASDDLKAALTPVAGRPVAFRTLVAVVRAGVARVGVPGVFRGTDVERAIAASPRVCAATVWLDADRLEPTATLLVPAAALTAPAPLAAMLATPPPARTTAAEHDGAPVVGADAALTAALANALATGSPVGDELGRALESREAKPVAADAWYVRVSDPRTARIAEDRLFAGLGSVIDTPLDRALHRRLSRHVTRTAIALGITPNQISVVSLLVGLAAAWCFWNATALSALLGLGLYVASVVLDHSDGEVARLRLAESALGEWLDILIDTIVHAALVVAMGVTSHTVTGSGLVLGLVGAVGIIASALVAKLWSATTTATPVGSFLQNLGSRDGFYALLILFIAARALLPSVLPILMIIVTLGSHAYWLARTTYTLTSR